MRDQAKQSTYNKAYYERRKAEKMLAAAPELSDEPGRVERGVQAEIDALGVDRPGAVESLLAMARLIDDPAKWSQHSSADRRLQAGLSELRSVSGTRKARLASVRDMNSRVS